jgi:hypothetical protein
VPAAAVETHKRCSRCHEAKPLSAFPRDGRKADGHAARCKVCDGQIAKAQYRAKASRRKAIAKARTEAQGPTVRRCICGCGQPTHTPRHKYATSCKPAPKRGDAKLGKTVERGYDARHRRERQRVARLIRGGTEVCCRCGNPLPPDIPSDMWHLDHTEDRTGYLGPAHKECNEKAARAKPKRQTQRRSRDWF